MWPQIVFTLFLACVYGYMIYDLDSLRGFVNHYLLTPFDNLPFAVKLLSFFFIGFWWLGATKTFRMVPRPSETVLKSEIFIKTVTLFIASKIGVSLNYKKELPKIYIFDSEKDLLQNFKWTEEDQNLEGESIHGTYIKELGRIFIVGRRVDLWFHELTHYVQIEHKCVNKVGDNEEEEACFATRQCMRKFYPFYYWLNIILYGSRGIWDCPLYRYMPF